MTLAQWLTRPDRNRPRFGLEREVGTWLSAGFDLGCGWLRISIGPHALRIYWGHDWRRCDCDACIPF